MRIVRFSRDAVESIGVLGGRGVIDIQSVWPGTNPPKSVVEILQRGNDCLAKIKELAQSSGILTPVNRSNCLRQ